MPGAPAELPPQYDPQAEPAVYQSWLAGGYFTVDPTSGKPPFCIVIPPPNVTGSLHMGHAFEHTIQDALVRRRRMQGYEALWLPGTDHAGIATQNVVERELAGEGLSRHQLGRAGFTERVWRWKERYGDRIQVQMRRLGDSVDWTRERFTMDAQLSRAVGTMFRRLYQDELIYRAERIINWCPRCLTALSDIEVDHRDVEGELVYLRYGEPDRGLVVATTRVETMLGDTAVAVHPDDDRYRGLVGSQVELPLTGRRIPVIADDHVDPAFGTGAVKVTPAHDPNDFAIGERHHLPALVVMDERGLITAPGPFAGLDRFEARPAVTDALREQGRIVREQRPYLHAVGHCSRCQTVVEPRLSLQWFVRVAELAKAAGDAVRDGRIRIHPEEMTRRWFDWVDDMHDWCISRQLWWGHRIPVWYGPGGEIRVVGPGDAPPSGEGWTQDPDVLDTWFSSGLWPFSTLGWPDRTPDLACFYPTSLLVTGYDILFFWVARMAMFGLYAMDGAPPFHAVSLHGMVRDRQGRKLSKSHGNAVDPLAAVDSYGADALRFTLARGANPGTDVSISDDAIRASRNFVNKLWNAGRFVLRQGGRPGRLPPPADRTVAERWILSRLATVTAAVDRLYEQLELAKARELLFHFAWDEFCDWCIELAKLPGTVRPEVLGQALDVLLRLLHPIVPFVTERLWTALTGEPTLVLAAWPTADPAWADPAAEREMAELMGVVTEIRRFRAEQRVPTGRRPPAVLDGPADAPLRRHETAVRALAGLAGATGTLTAATRLPAGGGTLLVDLASGVDVAAERARLARELAAARTELQRTAAKLADPRFRDGAPAPVVSGMRRRHDTAAAEVDRLHRQLAALPAG